jgi:Concanavalin A-like lectin/glucanases superfamily
VNGRKAKWAAVPVLIVSAITFAACGDSSPTNRKSDGAVEGGTGGAASGGAGGTAAGGHGGTAAGGSGGTAAGGHGGTAAGGSGGTAAGGSGGTAAGGSGGQPTDAGTGGAGGADVSDASADGSDAADVPTSGDAGDAAIEMSAPAPATVIPSGGIGFGAVSCGSAGGIQLLSFTNTGNAVLHYQASIAAGGFYTLQGAAGDGSVTADVNAGATATVTIVAGVVPTTTAAGASLEGTLIITTNALGAENVQIALALTAQGGTCTLTCGTFTKCTPGGAPAYCANTATDNANCGACAHACGAGEVCSGSACALTCGALTTCTLSGTPAYCANTDTDGANCGTCGHACASGEVCTGGVCTLTCGALAKCTPSGGAPYCANTATDGANCGACAHACGTGEVCTSGTCTLSCGALTKCSPSSGSPYCANTTTDNTDCGTCGHACGTGYVCSGGTCTLTCGSLTKCTPTTGSPYCANTATDNADCGTCGHACGAGEACTGGACVLTCGSLTKCTPMTGSPYCANTATDNADCGTCGHACGTGYVCSGGTCTLTCGSLTKCTPMTGSPYCANTATSNADCGTCGHACSTGQACVSGTCTATCGSSETVCGGMCTNTSYDPSNCSTCGHTCTFPNGSAACSGGNCFLTACDSGHLDCDHTQGNGCEVDKSADVANCGACGHACGLGETCNSGVCTANLTQGLIGYWNMDDAAGSTSAADSTTNHLDGLVQGGVTFVPGAGKQGTGAASLAGNGYLRVAFPNNVQNKGSGVFIPQGNITFAMWFKTSSLTIGALQVVEGNGPWGSGCDRIVGASSGGSLNYNSWSEVNMSGSTTVNDGVWHHLTYVLDRVNGFRAYIDGVLDVSSLQATTNCGVGCSGFDWAAEYWIGRGAACRFGADFFTGLIDDVRLYDHVLSPAAALQLYNTTK